MKTKCIVLAIVALVCAILLWKYDVAYSFVTKQTALGLSIALALICIFTKRFGNVLFAVASLILVWTTYHYFVSKDIYLDQSFWKTRFFNFGVLLPVICIGLGILAYAVGNDEYLVKMSRTFDRNVKAEYNRFKAWLYCIPNGDVISGDKMALYFRRIIDDPSMLPTIKANDNPNPLKDPKTVFCAAMRDYEEWLAKNAKPISPVIASIAAKKLAQEKWDNEPVCKYCGGRGWAGWRNEAGDCRSSPHGRHEMK